MAAPAQVPPSPRSSAELSADSRLNHIIKGCCGSAISAIDTFSQLLGPYLKEELPPEVAGLLVAPIAKLREAIDWCQRRQVFVDLEERRYVSSRTPVDINPLLEASLVGSGTLYSNIEDALALDKTVLCIALDEGISNALKYRKWQTDIVIVACYREGFLRLEISNTNRDGMATLSHEECARVMTHSFKAHTGSAMSDGLGLDSVACAVNAAGGEIRLEQTSSLTTLHLCLPAALRMRTKLGECASPEQCFQASKRPVSKYFAGKSGTTHSPKLLRASLSSTESTREYTPSSTSSSMSAVSRSSASSASSISSLLSAQRTCIPTFSRNVQATQFARCWADRQPVIGISAARNPSVSHIPASGSLHPLTFPLSCVGLIDNRAINGNIKSIFLSTIFSHIAAQSSDIIASARDECDSFIHRVLGRPNDDKGSSSVTADIVIMTYYLCSPSSKEGPLLAAELARRLRQHGYVGLIGIIVDEQTPLELEELCSLAEIDVVIEKNTPMEDVVYGLLHHTALKKGSSPQLWAGNEHNTRALNVAIENRALLRSRTRWHSPLNMGQELCCSRMCPHPLEDVATRLSNGVKYSESPVHACPCDHSKSHARKGVDKSSETTAPPKLRVVGLDDERIPRMVQTLLIKHHLHADIEASCVLGESEEEMIGFVDVALGHRDKHLHPNYNELRPADVVLLDENIRLPDILGSRLASALRQRSFTGVVVLLTAASASKVAELRSIPAVDLVFEKGSSLTQIAAEILAEIERKRGKSVNSDEEP